IYPLMELNWTYYTSNGHARDQNFEGLDLFNFGATSVSGQNHVSLALGARYKFCEWLQTGIAAEWAVAGKKDLQNFRLTFDVISRYYQPPAVSRSLVEASAKQQALIQTAFP